MTEKNIFELPYTFKAHGTQVSRVLFDYISVLAFTYVFDYVLRSSSNTCIKHQTTSSIIFQMVFKHYRNIIVEKVLTIKY